jgi:plastocyanin
MHGNETERGIHSMKVSLALSILFVILSGGNSLWAEAPAGSLVGRIVFSGAYPPDQIVEITRDVSVCGKTATTRTTILHRETKGLAGAVVSVDGIPLPMTESLPPPVVIANSHCSFSPRIVAGQVGQQLILRNDDPIMHNTHLTLETRTFMNVALVPAGRPVGKPLKKPGIYQVKCDVHNFMTAAVLTFHHPFFSVTDETGAFRISHLPPGDHVVTIWHNTLGTFQQRITIPIQGEAHVTIEYPANARSQNK